MLKLFVILWFVILRTISSQLTNDNIRESRQLNFGECCPCPNSERSFKDQDMLGSRLDPTLLDDSCPCRSAQDSESASTIFRPAMTALEPSSRLKESAGEPKPLLKPEVGLASSVLETLREVTDQEYQEALERDAARSAIQEMERDIEDETPRSIVNIILQPKEDQIDDPLPEASHIQETRCIHTPLGRANTLDQKTLKTPARLFREQFYSPKDTNNKLLRNKYFDMANSASNVQELVIPPLKTNILEDLKLKSDLLKMKLFPSIRNSLKDTKYINTMSEVERETSGDSSKNIHALRVPNFKLASIVDLLKASKQKKLYAVSPSNQKEADDCRGNDFIASPTENHQFFINNEKTHKKPPTNALLKKEEILSNKNTNAIFDNNPESDKEITLNNSGLRIAPSTEPNLNKKLSSGEDILMKNACIINEDPLKEEVVRDSDNIQMLDVASSPSEIVQIERPVDEIRTRTDDDQVQQRDIASDVDMTQKKLDEESYEGDSKEAINLKMEGTENDFQKSKLCDMEDSEFSARNNSIRQANNQVNEEKNFSFENSNMSPKPDFNNNQLMNYDSSIIATPENVPTTIDPGNIDESKNLPNLKADILTTLENFKKANEIIQEKLRSNVQNALQLDLLKKKQPTEIPTSTLSTITNDASEDSSKVSKNLNMQDLQEMSDRILDLSETTNGVATSDLITKKIESPNDLKDSETLESKDIITESRSSEITTPAVSKSLLMNSDEVDKNLSNEEKNNKSNELNSESKTKPCIDGVPNTDQLMADVISPNDHENEMMSEASSPIVNSIRQFNNDFIPQPRPDIDLKEFLINLRSSVSDILNDNLDINPDTNTNSFHVNDNSNSIFLKKEPNIYFKETPSRLNDPLNMDLFKPRRNNDLNTYQAKVPSPESLDIKAIPSILKNRVGTNKLLTDNPEMTSASNVLQNPMKLPSASNFKAISDDDKKSFEPRINLQKSNLIQDIIPKTESIKSFSENLKSRTEEALRNIQDTFDSTLRKPLPLNRNNIFSETITKPDVLGTISKTNYDINKKLQEFNSDLKDKLLTMSQRSAGIIPPRDFSTLLNRNKINDFSNGLKNIAPYHPQAKTNVLQKPNKPHSFIDKINKGSLSMPHLPKNLDHSPHRLSSDLIEKHLQKSRPGLKTPLTKMSKRKPLKESKVNFSFTTTSAPETIKSISNQKTLSKPSILRSSINLPKSSTQLKTPLQKRLELKSKLKAGDPKPSASEIYTSHTAFPKGNLDTHESLNTFSSKEDSKLAPLSLINEENSRSENAGFYVENIPDVLKTENSHLSQLNKKLFDIRNNILKKSSSGDVQTASNNINIASTSLIEKPLKENVSYKCKMICFEDFGDTK